MATEDEVAAGLIDWINSFDLKEPVQSINNLSDGELLWKVLQQIDGFSFVGSLPEPPEPSSPTSPSPSDRSWIRKWNNLKHLYDALSLFLIEECDQRLPLFTATSGGRTRPDLKAIAQHASLPDSVLLLKLCVVAAINCADRIEFLKKMQELAESTQEVLMTTAQEAGEGNDEDMADEADDANGQLSSQNSNELDPSMSPYMPVGGTGMDSALASEERLGKVIADNQRIALEKREIQRQLDDLFHRFERLQEKNDRTQEELNETNDRLTAVLSGKVDGAQNKAADQKSDVVIAALETRVVAAETEVEELRKNNEVLKIKADRVQKLQDDYDEIKIERDRLSRKANTAEKYRQKLESIQDMDKENESLKTKVSELQAQIKQSDSSRASSSNLQREIDEYRRLLPSIEQERYDLNEMKKRLEFDYHTLEARYQDLVEQLARSHGQVEDLQGRLRDYEDGMRPSTPPPKQSYELESRDWEKEEADFVEAEARLTAALLESSSKQMENGKDDDGEGDRDGDRDGKETETKADKEVDENGISEDELRAIMAAMRAQAQVGTAVEKETGLRTQKRLLVAIEKQRSKNMSLADHVKQQSDLIVQLRTSIDEEKASAAARASEETGGETEQPIPLTEPKVEPEPVAATTPVSPDEARVRQIMELNENLKREIRLMTSAWYEQNQRMASSGAAGYAVSMMRSKNVGGSGGGSYMDEPKSFLGQQRRLISSVILGNGSGVKGRR